MELYENIIKPLEKSKAIIYCLRHQESLMNALGYGDENSPLTQKGREDALLIKELIQRIESKTHPIDAIFIGNLPRHTQTLEEIKAHNFQQKTPIIQDSNLNAVAGGYLFEEPNKRKIEEKYGLSRFKADKQGFYDFRDGSSIFRMDPEKEQIYPFDLHCSAIVDKRLRKLVFGDNDPLTSFEEIEKNVKNLEANLKEHIDPSKKQSTIVCIGSCSALAFIMEYAEYGTIGEHIAPLIEADYESEMVNARLGQKSFLDDDHMMTEYHQTRLYPQDHNEFSVLHFNRESGEAINCLTRYIGPEFKLMHERIQLFAERQHVEDYL